MLGATAIGNATLIVHDGAPVLATEPGLEHLLERRLVDWTVRHFAGESPLHTAARPGVRP